MTVINPDEKKRLFDNPFTWLEYLQSQADKLNDRVIALEEAVEELRGD